MTERGKHNAVYPAQADNLAVNQATDMLTRAIDSLGFVMVGLNKPKPSPEARLEMRRLLSGVLASVETVRVSIRE